MQYTKLRRYNSDIHILVIPKGRFYVTRFGLRTVSATAQALQAPVAINGGDYNAYGAVGLAASDGHVYSKQVEWQPWVNFTRSNIPQINAFDSPESKWNALAGKRFLVYGRKRWPTQSAAWYERHPRTLIGVTLDAQCIMMVVDGRTPQSAGITLFEGSDLMMDIGAWRAMDLDGGGSSAMWLNGRIVNVPIDGGVPGKERAVGTQIVAWVDEVPPVEDPPETPEVSMYEGNVKSTATPYLNVRNAPSKDGTKVGALKPGQAVIVEYIENGWAKVIDPVVSNNKDRQWALASYLNLVAVTDPEIPGSDPPAGEYVLHVKDGVTRKFVPDE